MKGRPALPEAFIGVRLRTEFGKLRLGGMKAGVLVKKVVPGMGPGSLGQLWWRGGPPISDVVQVRVLTSSFRGSSVLSRCSCVQPTVPG